MNGAHDLGGKHGFGDIDRSQTENFAHEWEEKVFGLTLACGMLGKWNLDQSRFARESTDPAEYLASGYYEHWLHGLELLLVEQGVVTSDELRSGSVNSAHQPSAVAPEKVAAILATGAPTQLPDTTQPRFKINDQVVVINRNPRTHTRAPAYVMGRVGTVISHHGSHIYADEHAATAVKQARHLYGVRFEATELWGKDCETKGTSAVFLDLFEPYLISLADHVMRLNIHIAGPADE